MICSFDFIGDGPTRPPQATDHQKRPGLAGLTIITILCKIQANQSNLLTFKN